MTEMTINKLPSKTWYWLKVNETKLPWDFEHTTELPEENISVGQEETARFSITGEGEYSSKKINIHAAKGETTTVFMDYAPTGKLAVYTNLTLEEDAHIRLMQRIRLYTMRFREPARKMRRSSWCRFIWEKAIFIRILQLH